jgi:hypothetical protein
LGEVGGRKITFSKAMGSRDNPLRIRLRDLCEHVYTVESDIGLESIKIRFPNGISGTATYTEQEVLLKELAAKENILRNAVFEMKSPWTADYWQGAVGNLKDSGYIDKGYSFSRSDFLEYILFDPDNEYIIFDSIFRGEGKLLDPNADMYYIHPVTFLWMLSVMDTGNSEKSACFSGLFKYDRKNPVRWAGLMRESGGTADNLSPGENIKVLAVAESVLPGVPDPDKIQLNENIEVPIHLDREGISVQSLAADYWGAYEISGLGSGINGLPRKLVVKEPVIKGSVINASEKTVTLEFGEPYSEKIQPVMGFEYAITRSGSRDANPAMNALDKYLVLTRKNQGKTKWGYDLEPIFDEIRSVYQPLSPSEDLILKYKVILYDASHITVPNKNADGTGGTVSFKGGGIPEKIRYITAGNSTQEIPLNAVYPKFNKEPLEIHGDLGEGNTYRVCAGLTFADDSIVVDESYFKTEVNIEYEGKKEGERRPEGKGYESKVVKNGRELICQIKVASYFFDIKAELTVSFINAKEGPRREFEARKTLVNPIQSTELKYDREKKEAVCRITIDAKGKLFPQSCDACRVKLVWYNSRSKEGSEIPWEKWLTDGARQRQAGVQKDSGDTWKIDFSIPFAEIRGDSVWIELYDASGTCMIVNSWKTKMEGLPDMEGLKGPWMIKTGETSAGQGPVLMRSENLDPIGDEKLEIGKFVWVLFDAEGNGIKKLLLMIAITLLKHIRKTVHLLAVIYLNRG